MNASLKLDSSQKKALINHYRKRQKSRSHTTLYLALAACLILAFAFRPSSQVTKPSITASDLAQVNEIEKQMDQLFDLRRNIKKQGLNQQSRKLSSNLKSNLNKSLSSRLRKSKQKIKAIKQKLS